VRHKSAAFINAYQTEHQNIFFTEGFLMDDRTSQPSNDPQLDDAVWNAWVKKNETQDKIRFARRKKMLGVILILGVVVLLVWRLTRFGVAFG
jgi:hypothetical protein